MSPLVSGHGGLWVLESLDFYLAPHDFSGAALKRNAAAGVRRIFDADGLLSVETYG